jgi:D-amino-acid dehydrogenase
LTPRGAALYRSAAEEIGVTRKVDVIVMGAGFVGLGAALALQARGRSVAILDKHPQAAGETSFGNTGIVQSEAVYPYGFPRDPLEIAKAALNRDPRAQIRHASLPGIAPALWRYFLASGGAEREHSGKALRALVAPAVDAHRDLAAQAGAEALLRAGGWIKIFRTSLGQARGLDEAEEARAFGVNYRLLDRAALTELEPHLSETAIGGVHFTDPLTTSDPAALANAYLALFVRRGGVMETGDARTLTSSGDGWRAMGAQGTIDAREAVVALGPWSNEIAKSLGYDLPFFVKRGYHMHYAPRGNAGLTRPVLDYEKGYVVTPMTRGLRLTTGAEFARPEDPPSPAHLDRLEPFAREIYPLAERRDPKPWLGRRPCLPDMLPIIGAAPRHPGLWFDFGHQHLGLTLGPISGRLLADMMTGEPPFTDPDPYRMERFG